MHESILVLGRTWGQTPAAWKNFCRSLPTHHLLRSTHMPSKLASKLNAICRTRALARFDAEYLRASNRHPARIRFKTQEGRVAWELTYD